MRFLKEELKMALVFILMVVAIGSFIYLLTTISPQKTSPEDECELGCPIHAPCPEGCEK
jgi:hypothetical protein